MNWKKNGRGGSRRASSERSSLLERISRERRERETERGRERARIIGKREMAAPWANEQW